MRLSDFGYFSVSPVVHEIKELRVARSDLSTIHGSIAPIEGYWSWSALEERGRVWHGVLFHFQRLHGRT